MTAARQRRLAERLLDRDPSAWKGDPAHQQIIRNALGWLDLPAQMRGEVPALESFAAEVAAAGYTDAVLVGMGGSSLAPDVLRRMYPAKRLRLHVLDTTSPETILGLRRGLDLKKTLVIVSSKSGTTTEAVSLYRYFWNEVGGHGDPFVAITDPGTWLENEARSKGFRHVFPGKVDVGGRFSALSNFGLVPGALMGVDIAALLAGGQEALDRADEAAELGAAMADAARAGRDKITFVMPPELEPFGDWLEQLLAESTGKEGKGLIPIVGEPVGKPDVYGNDRFFIRYGADEPSPGLTLTWDNLGHQFVKWEIAVAIAGACLGIDAFDQPNVQESKDNTVAILKAGEVPEEPVTSDLGEFLAQVRPGDYLAIMAYLPPTANTAQALARLRARLRDQLQVATTLGFGPRFLHSTGQIHKGGPNTCVALQITCTPHEDVAVPEAPYSFGTLWQAQATGDLQALRRHGRRAARVDLGSDVSGGLERLVKG
jgi:transaldolase/glucose-6-phosphate isomerase